SLAQRVHDGTEQRTPLGVTILIVISPAESDRRACRPVIVGPAQATEQLDAAGQLRNGANEISAPHLDDSLRYVQIGGQFGICCRGGKKACGLLEMTFC